MATIEFFYDSYAILEYVDGNPKYQKYFEEPIGITSIPNLMEVYYHLLRTKTEEQADEIFDSFLAVSSDYSTLELKNGMKKRLEMKQQMKLNISFVDALGYSIALQRGLKFLTGDREFEGMPNVEYVK